MKLTQLRDVIAVAELGGLRRAARRLGLAQPAITRSIRDLEHELGAALFERSAQGMALTPIGHAFVRRGMAAQLELDRARDEVRQLKGEGAGTVSIGLSTAPHVSLLPRVLASFRRKFPDVQLQIIEGLFPALETAVRDGMIDFYIGPLAEDRLSGEFVSEKLFHNRRLVFGRRGHPLSNVRTLKDLVDASWVSTSVTSSSEAELFPVFDRSGLPHPNIAVRTQTALSMISVAASSELLALLPQQWLSFAGRSRLLTHIEIDERIDAPPICEVHRANLPLTPIAERLSDLFKRAATFEVHSRFQS